VSHDSTDEKSAEMYRLLDEQTILLNNETPLSDMSSEELDRYTSEMSAFAIFAKNYLSLYRAE
jgi:hypothetical protein